MVHDSSTESTLKERNWSDDDSDKEDVGNVPMEEVESKLKFYSKKGVQEMF